MLPRFHSLQRGLVVASRRFQTTVTEPFDELKLELPYGKIAGKMWGNPNGSPVLCLHGWLDNSGSFDRLIPMLPLDKYLVVAVDLPGHGQSCHFPKGMTYKASDSFYVVKKVYDHFNWQQAKVIGHSMGAGLSSLFSAIFPEMVERLVMLDLIGVGPAPVTKNVRKTRQSIEETLDVFEKLYSGKLSPPEYSYKEAVDRAYIANSKMHGKNSILRSSVEVIMKRGMTKVSDNEDRYRYNSDLRLRISSPFNLVLEQSEQFVMNIKSPIMIVKATDSPLYMSEDSATRLLKSYTNANPNFEYFVVPGGHHVHLNNPELVAPLICDFFAKNFTNDGTEDKQNYRFDLY